MSKLTTKDRVIIGSLSLTAAIGLVGTVYFGIRVIKKHLKMRKETEEINKELNKDLPPEKEEGNNDREPSVREKLLRNWDKPDIGEGASLEDEMAEAEHPIDDDEEDDPIRSEEMDAMEKSLEADTFYRDHKNEPPVVVTDPDSFDVPAGVETEEWIYFDKDGVMTNEEEIPIDDYKRFVGDTLYKADFFDNDEMDHIYVMSFEYMTLYSITKYFVSYAEKKEGSEEYFEDLRSNYE